MTPCICLSESWSDVLISHYEVRDDGLTWAIYQVCLHHNAQAASPVGAAEWIERYRAKLERANAAADEATALA